MYGTVTIGNRKNTRRKGALHFYIGRPTALGNPYPISKHVTRDTAIMLYGAWIEHPEPRAERVLAELTEHLRQGQDIELVCYCSPAPCHGDKVKQELEKRLATGR